MLVHLTRDVGDVEVGVALIGEFLELGIERFLSRMTISSMEMIAMETKRTHPSEADFVAKIVEATNAVLSILVVMILDEAEAV